MQNLFVYSVIYLLKCSYFKLIYYEREASKLWPEKAAQKAKETHQKTPISSLLWKCVLENMTYKSICFVLLIIEKTPLELLHLDSLG